MIYILNLEPLIFLQDLHWDTHRMECTKTQKYMQNTAKFIFEHEKVPDKNILSLVKRCNAKETLSSDGWSRSYSPVIDKCTLCDNFLSPLTKKRRRSGEDRCLLISTEHVLEIDVFTKQCKLCCIIQGVPQNSLRFSISNFSAYDALNKLILDIFQ